MKKIKHQIAAAFMVIAVSSMSIIALINFIQAKRSLTLQVFDHLTSIKNIKGEEIKNYFQTLSNLSRSFSDNKATLDAFLEFNAAYENLQKEIETVSTLSLHQMTHFRDVYYFNRYKNNTTHDPLVFSEYKSCLSTDKTAIFLQYLLHDTTAVNSERGKEYLYFLSKYQPSFSSFAQHVGFVDILMINSQTGKIIYTTLKECDLGASVMDSMLINSNVTKLFNDLKSTTIPGTKAIDYEVYFPSNNTPQSFLGCPVIEKGKNIGVLFFQISSSKVNRIMTFNNGWKKSGMGKTGETFIVGGQNSMRSQSRFYLENKAQFITSLQQLHYPDEEIESIQKYDNTIKNIRILTLPANAVLAGETGTALCKDYMGMDVLASYMPLDFFGYHWGIVAKMDTSEAFGSIYYLKFFTTISFILLILVVLVVSVYFSNYLTRPIISLTNNAKEISEGNFNSCIEIKRKDEIGVLASSFKSMQSTIINLIGDLKSSNFNLEEKQREILDSIKYARKIQDNVLAGDGLLRQHLTDFFVLFQPRDIVSGDFYWAIHHTETFPGNVQQGTHPSSFYFAICDSTGHGIPGAFMSLLNISFLNECITEKGIKQPHLIFNEVRNLLIKTISNEENHDGMDGVLLRFLPGKKRVEYAAAYNAPILIRKGEIIHCNADRIPVGKSIKEHSFTLFHIDIEEGDTLYVFTDGFADQFGGTFDKKYKLKNFITFLLNIHTLDMKKQQEALENELKRWTGPKKQIDDVLVIGIRF